MNRPTIVDSRQVVLRGQATGTADGNEFVEITGPANSTMMWVAWAYYTCRHFTWFSWSEIKKGSEQQRIWMNPGEARQYLIHRAMADDKYAQECWEDLRARGLVPAVGLLPRQGAAPPALPVVGVPGWGPYCTRCRLSLSTTNMQGYEAVGGRYYGLCDNCKEPK